MKIFRCAVETGIAVEGDTKLSGILQNVLDGKYGNSVLPFFWQHGEDEKTLREEIARIQQAHIGALCVESRPHPDFLGPGWWRDMDCIMDECRRRSMKVWLLDDELFPTGYAAGAVKKSAPECRKLFLKEKHIDVSGPMQGGSLLLSLKEGEELLGVVAGKRTGDADQTTGLTDITQNVSPDDEAVYWDIPQGIWRVFFLYLSHDSGHQRLDQYLNPLTAEGTDVLLETVYQAHYKRYGGDFGKTFAGFFSDEPQFGNAYGYHASIGRVPFMPLPWCRGLEKQIMERAEDSTLAHFPGFWYDIGEKTFPMRYFYMDAITRLYRKNFSNRIGGWCRRHHVEYIGHVIEENNCHARLGNGAGHYFRSLWGQDMAGIDVVLHQIIPGMKGMTHAWVSRDFEADDEFFYYGLAKLASSLAHIDPKKKGRAMCEIFGAYGWTEGIGQMKWLADFMLSRGINRFVPHAFSPKAFPDPDCPPHFYARGKNPQYRFYYLLMDYMNRICRLFSGGLHVASAAVLYHAEAEWSGNSYMLCQKPMRALMEHQIDADFLPADVLLGGDGVLSDDAMTLESGMMRCSGETYRMLIIPYTQAIPEALLRFIAKASAEKFPVCFIGGFPIRTCEGRKLGQDDFAGCLLSSLKELPDLMEKLGTTDITVSTFEPDLRTYHYRQSDGDFYLLFNESIRKEIKVCLRLNDARPATAYDPLDNRTFPVKCERNGRMTEISLDILSGQSLVLAFGEEPVSMSGVPVFRPVRSERAALENWHVSLSPAGEYPDFKLCQAVSGPGNLNALGKLPRFSGTVRYEADFKAGGEDAPVSIDLGAVGEIAQVWLNGRELGVKFVPPYRWDITGAIRSGTNHLTVEVTNTLVYQQHDELSFFQPIPPSGLIGPVTFGYPTDR